jgi:hypothetical protein
MLLLTGADILQFHAGKLMTTPLPNFDFPGTRSGYVCLLFRAGDGAIKQWNVPRDEILQPGPSARTDAPGRTVLLAGILRRRREGVGEIKELLFRNLAFTMDALRLRGLAFLNAVVVGPAFGGALIEAAAIGLVALDLIRADRGGQGHEHGKYEQEYRQ